MPTIMAFLVSVSTRGATLTPRKDADIVMLRADRLSLLPLNHAPGTVVNLMNPGNVDTVFVAGKVRKWRGNLVASKCRA
jgi:5-methylthioadenosine/S-adenosylhomocysteine deaminase